MAFSTDQEQAPRTIRNFLGVIVLLGIVAALFAISLDALTSFFAHRGPASLLGNGFAALLVPLMPVFGILLLGMIIDRYERTPWSILITAFGWGSLMALVAYQVFEWRLTILIGSIDLEQFPAFFYILTKDICLALGISTIEEILKGMGLMLIVLLWHRHFENMTDGILYGAFIGGGFALVENLNRFNATDSQSTLFYLIVGRLIMGWLGHSAFTAILGAAVGMAREFGYPLFFNRISWLGLVVAIACHAVFDVIAFVAADSISQWPGILTTILVVAAVLLDYVALLTLQGIIYIMVARSQAREAGILREYLQDEVREGVVAPDEYLTLQQASLKLRLQRALLLGYNPRLWLAIRNMYRSEVQLAFAKWRYARRYKTRTDGQDIARYRQMVQQYHNQIVLIDRG